MFQVFIRILFPWTNFFTHICLSKCENSCSFLTTAHFSFTLGSNAACCGSGMIQLVYIVDPFIIKWLNLILVTNIYNVPPFSKLSTREQNMTPSINIDRVVFKIDAKMKNSSSMVHQNSFQSSNLFSSISVL